MLLFSIFLQNRWHELIQRWRQREAGVGVDRAVGGTDRLSARSSALQEREEVRLRASRQKQNELKDFLGCLRHLFWHRCSPHRELVVQKVASCCRRGNQVSYKYSKVGACQKNKIIIIIISSGFFIPNLQNTAWSLKPTKKSLLFPLLPIKSSGIGRF